MPLRSSLRTVVLAAVAVGAVCVPATSAFADSSAAPTSTPASRGGEPSAAPSATPTVAPSEARRERAAAMASEAPRGGVAAGDSPTPTAVPSVRMSSAPRGGVAAGERPSGTSGDNTTAVMGSATAALLVAGAGTVVLRRRSAGRRNG